MPLKFPAIAAAIPGAGTGVRAAAEAPSEDSSPSSPHTIAIRRGNTVAEDVEPLAERLIPHAEVGSGEVDLSLGEEVTGDQNDDGDEDEGEDEWEAEEKRYQAKLLRKENDDAVTGDGLFDDGGRAVGSAVRALAKRLLVALEAEKERSNSSILDSSSTSSSSPSPPSAPGADSLAAATDFSRLSGPHGERLQNEGQGQGEEKAERNPEDQEDQSEEARLARAEEIVKNNMFRFQHAVTHDTFLCVFVVFSLFNHSCAPNACVVLPLEAGGVGVAETEESGVGVGGAEDGQKTEEEGQAAPFEGRARVVAIRDIAPGEEITIDYGAAPLLLPRDLRRGELKKGWGFDCACVRCRDPPAADRNLETTAPDPLPEREAKRTGIMFDVCTGAALTRRDGISVGMLPEEFFDDAWMGRCKDFVRSDALGNAHWRKMVVRELVLPYILGDGEWELGAQMLEDHIRAMRQILPSCHVAKVTYCRTLHFVLGQSTGAGLQPAEADERVSAVEPEWPELKRIYLGEETAA
jgi:SET domain